MLAFLPPDGSTIGNQKLRQQLEWKDEKYFIVRDSLVQKEELVPGRGRGGTVRLAKAIPPPVAPTEVIAEIEKEQAAEGSHYDNVEKVLKDKWSKDRSLDNFFVQTLARQGRRETGGTWTRPDHVLVSVSTYQYVPGKHVEVVTFEVKTAHGCDVTAVYEALAHRRAATAAFVIVVASAQQQRKYEDILDQIAEEAGRHGVGFIVAEHSGDYATWNVRVEAITRQPEPARLEDFIDTQIDNERKKQLRKWLS